jgi:O-antigen ligase
VFLFIIGTIWSPNKSVSFSSSIRFLTIALFITAIWDIFDNQQKVYTALQALILGGYVSTLGTIFVYFQSSGGYFRQAFYGYNVNYMAGTLVVTIPIAMILAKERRSDSVIMSLVNGIYVLLGIIAIIITGSRMGIVALAPTIVLSGYYIGINSSLSAILRNGVIIVIAATSLYKYTGIINGERISYISTIPNEIISGDFGGARGEIWRGGLIQGLESPLFGFGTRSFRYVVTTSYTGASAHNSFLQIFVDLGLIGLLTYILIILTVFRSAIRTAYKYEWVVFVVTYCLISVANNFELNVIMWLIFTFCIRLSID